MADASGKFQLVQADLDNFDKILAAIGNCLHTPYTINKCISMYNHVGLLVKVSVTGCER